MEESKININNENLIKTVNEFDKTFIEKNDNNLNNEGLSKVDDWDNTPVSGVKETPSPEAFIIPIDDVDGKLKSTNKQANTYAAKKTVAQGMMDIALITANANQLRFVLEYTSGTKTYYFNIILISISIILQIAIGIALIFKGRSDLRGESKFKHARRSNNFVVIGVFLVTILNMFIASFSSASVSNNQSIVNPTSTSS